MDKTYNPSQYEEEIYQAWEKSGAFKAPTGKTAKKNQKPFTIIMPPPNANDPLHMGHAMFVAVEDILTRYHRMKGEAALWLPGTDHAGIETQYVFEKKLNKKGQSRFSFDRETLFKKIWAYVQKNSDVATNQMKRLGASADWSRFKFTLDPDIVDFVLSTFEQLYKDKLVYRAKRLVNYCTKCGTSFSELEVNYQERPGQLWYISYPLINSQEKITVATTRPETMLGDTGLAVNPKDKRFKALVGKIAVVPLVNREIPIVADKEVDPEFGTGVVKVTPAHDQTDFDIGQRHQLDSVQVINYQGKMTQQAGDYAGLNVAQAREKVVADLNKQGLLIKTDKTYQHRIGVCYRCGRVIEPLPMTQFFIKVKPLVKPVLKNLKDKKTKVCGPGRKKILIHWLKNLRDWNISRQIVWGIRMPIWYEINEKNNHIVVGFLNNKKQFVQGTLEQLLKKYSLKQIKSGLQLLQAPQEAEFKVARKSPGKNYLQETDTFDTWFSSGQWPVATLKTSQPGDFENYYPTSVMETAYDILMFWVMRMMMLGIYLTDRSPFKSVYLHGLIRDEQGQKMSKSKGNVINPLDLVEKYGADALRLALVLSSTPGKDAPVGESKVRGMRNLTNKIWNAARFIKLASNDNKSVTASNDKKFLKKLAKISQEISNLLDELKIGLAAEKTYNYFWHWYCDECIESAKNGQISYEALFHGLIVFLKLLHPFVPFVTEAVWFEIKDLRKQPEQLLINSAWPK